MAGLAEGYRQPETLDEWRELALSSIHDKVAESRRNFEANQRLAALEAENAELRALVRALAGIFHAHPDDREELVAWLMTTCEGCTLVLEAGLNSPIVQAVMAEEA